MSLRMSVLPDSFAICRLAPEAVVPSWATQGAFFSITRTTEELSIILERERIPADVGFEGPWRAFKVEGPIQLSAVGILASIAEPLAQADISLFAISTFDTDYVLVQADQLEAAQAALCRAGHTIH
jgi:uncharacterized protein